MPRPQTKDQLLFASDEGYRQITGLLQGLDERTLCGEFSFAGRDRNVRDVLWHLVAWHEFMLTWYAEGNDGLQPAKPAPGYTWKTTPGLNQTIWKDAQEVGYERAIERFRETHNQVQAIIERHSDEELFTKRFYPWTGSTSLGSYLVSATSSHYDWALKILKEYKKSLA